MFIGRNEVRQIFLKTIEAMLELQLRAACQIQGSEELPPPVRIKRGLHKNSLVDLSVKLIQEEGHALHVDEIVVLIL